MVDGLNRSARRSHDLRAFFVTGLRADESLEIAEGSKEPASARTPPGGSRRVKNHYVRVAEDTHRADRRTLSLEHHRES